MLRLHFLDIIILLILVAGLARGLSTGLIRQVAGFVGLVLAFIVSVRLMHVVGELIVQSLGISPNIAPLAGFIAVFLVIQIIVFTVIRMMESVIGALKLTGVNRFLGGIVGGLKAVLILSVVFLVLNNFELPSDHTRKDSSLYRPVATLLPEVWDYVYENFPEVRKLTETFGDRLEEELNESGR